MASRYAAARVRDYVPWLVGTALLFIADLRWDVGWWFWAGMVTGFVATEVAKWRMRRLNREFAPHLPWLREQDGDDDVPV